MEILSPKQRLPIELAQLQANNSSIFNKPLLHKYLSIYYIQKNIKKSYRNSEFKISETTWDDEF